MVSVSFTSCDYCYNLHGCQRACYSWLLEAMKKAREYIPGADVIRVLSGFGVVLIHVTDPFLVYPPFLATGGASWWGINIVNTAFRFSVPLFVMLSGYLLLTARNDGDYVGFYKKRFSRIAIPALFWILFYIVWWYFLGKDIFSSGLLASFITVNLEHLYFLFIIVELYFISPVLMIFNKGVSGLGKKTFAISSSMFTLLVGAGGAYAHKAFLATSTNVFAIFVPFISYFYLGYYLRNIKLSLTQSIWVANIFLNCVLIAVILSSGDIFSFFRTYSSPTIFVMSVSVFLLLLNADVWKHIVRRPRLVAALRQVSGCVFGIYLVHMLVLNILDIYLPITPSSTQPPIWAWVGIKVLLVFGLSYLLVVVGKKIPKVGVVFG